ncbi:MAG: hypothetical protein JWQ66_4170 [Mucilaginibacter sp.]|nr:hypothetical protein [Mucilaginibacter sp.]
MPSSVVTAMQYNGATLTHNCDVVLNKNLKLWIKS